jgi:hypothetical protein
MATSVNLRLFAKATCPTSSRKCLRPTDRMTDISPKPLNVVMRMSFAGKIPSECPLNQQ